MRRINLLYVITKLELGGAQMQLLALLKGMDKERFELFVFTAAEGFLLSDFCSLKGVTIVKSRCLERAIRPFYDLCVFFEIYRFIKKNGIDIVHTHSSKAGIIGRFAARLAGASTIIHTVHGWSFNDFQPSWKQALFACLERMAARVSHALIVVSEHDLRKGQSRGIGFPKNYRLIRYGIDTAVYEKARASAEPRHGRGVVVGTIACLKPQKAPEDFLRLASCIVHRFPEARFVMAGDGILRTKVERLMRALRLEDSFSLLGWCRDIPAFLAGIDVFVLTSLWEGLPIAVLEAMASSLPVVATDTGGIAEVFTDGETGFLAAPHRVDDLVARVSSLLQDAALRKKVGEGARMRIGEDFSISTMVCAHQKLYDELLKRQVAYARE